MCTFKRFIYQYTDTVNISTLLPVLVTARTTIVPVSFIIIRFCCIWDMTYHLRITNGIWSIFCQIEIRSATRNSVPYSEYCFLHQLPMDVDTWYLLLELSDDLHWRHNNLCGTHCLSLSKDNNSSLPKYLRRGITIHKMATCGASDEVGWWHAIDWCCDNDQIYFAGPERHNHQFYDTTEYKWATSTQKRTRVVITIKLNL